VQDFGGTNRVQNLDAEPFFETVEKGRR